MEASRHITMELSKTAQQHGHIFSVKPSYKCAARLTKYNEVGLEGFTKMKPAHSTLAKQPP